jgi:hypothetical protein
MKTIILLLISSVSFAQPFAGIGLETSAARMSIGVAVENWEVSAGYSVPFTRADKPAVYSLELGHVLGNETWTVVPSAGYAMVKQKLFSGDKITDVSKVTAIFGLEAGWNQAAGRLAVYSRYSTTLQFGIILKAYLR